MTHKSEGIQSDIETSGQKLEPVKKIKIFQSNYIW